MSPCHSCTRFLFAIRSVCQASKHLPTKTCNVAKIPYFTFLMHYLCHWARIILLTITRSFGRWSKILLCHTSSQLYFLPNPLKWSILETWLGALLTVLSECQQYPWFVDTVILGTFPLNDVESLEKQPPSSLLCFLSLTKHVLCFSLALSASLIPLLTRVNTECKVL